MITPVELARLLELPEPTPEQARVISAPLAPMAVIAGAGSGKSETMAARVVWLVANGLVRPERVLGLTFTRKAAGELAARIRRRLDQLRDRLPQDELDRLGGEAALDGEPTVSTYHSYAARLFGDHALRAALEPTMRLISPAMAWQLAARVVDDYDGAMDGIDWRPDTVVRAVLDLSGELAEHLRTPEDVREIGRRLRAQFDALPGRRGAAKNVLATQEIRERLLPLVEAYQRAKIEREVLDYGDQVALAARIARDHPDVGMIERSRYAVVLLDEYQDTSHAQLVLLTSLFGGGHPVTAVGDPCQSIYGWRGAGSGNLTGFPEDFPLAPAVPSRVAAVPPPRPGRRPPRHARPAPTATLSISWRNGERILEVAARIQQGLRADTANVPRLRPGEGRRGRGRVECALLPTVTAEAEHIAERIRRLRAADPELAPDGLPWDEGPLKYSHIAVLVRRRSQIPPLRKALEERDIPVEVVGLGGLLTVPEVQDVVATLRVVHDPTAGASLARLLTGPRWRIGPRDLVALGRRARRLASENTRDITPPPDASELRPEPAANAEETDPLRQVVIELTQETGSLVDALDDLGDPSAYSPEGLARLRRLAAELRTLRSQVGLPLPDLVAEVERTLGLDIEVAARSGLDPAGARADLDAFIETAASFAEESENPTLGAFLAYLKAAESEEFGLPAGRVSESDSVKLLTVHAAKGLEWPVVVVPGLCYLPSGSGRPVKGSIFPSPPQQSTRWTDNPRLLPFELRGDYEKGNLPRLNGLTKADLDRFKDECADRDLREERRLAYVAVTRASHLLIATGHRWGATARPLHPSPFLEEIRQACETGAGRVVSWADPPEEGAANPLQAEAEPGRWPATPEGRRYAAIVEGAEMVRDAMVGRTAPWAGDDGLTEADRRRMTAWARDVELLLAERDRGRGGDVLQVELPAKLTVSTLVALSRDPQEVARSIRRPMPRPPAPYARRGTAFHRWLESRWGQQRLLDPDELPGAADEGAADDSMLTELQRRFEESEWASRRPLDIEVTFETVLGDRVLRGRMDAVFAAPDGGYEVVDWKTGRPPADEDFRHAAVQLAAYRLAWADLAGVPLEKVSAAFHYVRYNRTIRPADLLDRAGLTALLENIRPID